MSFIQLLNLSIMSTNEHERTILIQQYLFPLLGNLPSAISSRLAAQLEARVQLRKAVAGQYLEEPGPYDEGMAFLLPASIAHSFQVLDAQDARVTGTHIWARRTLVFDSHALLDKVDRAGYIEVLEPGPYLSIRFTALWQLMAEFEVVRRGVEVLARQQERQKLAYLYLLRLPPAQRVAIFEEQYRSFVQIAPIHVRSMHVGLTRQTYSKKLKDR